ncbi:hypothetical protein [Spirosoma sp.]
MKEDERRKGVSLPFSFRFSYFNRRSVSGVLRDATSSVNKTTHES